MIQPATPSFPVDPRLLAEARGVLARHQRLCWIIGGAAAGKTTICRALAARTGIRVLDMDERIYGGFDYRPQRHPANTAWLAAPNPLDWALSLTPETFDAFNRATTAEYLDLLAADLAARDPREMLLVDGGITHPALAAQALAPTRLLCLATSDAARREAWARAADRQMMRDWIAELPDAAAKWQQFLLFDRLIAQTLERESREQGIRIVLREPGMSVDTLTGIVATHFGI